MDSNQPTNPTPWPAADPMGAPGVTEFEKNYSLVMHLTTIALHIVPVPLIPVLIMWLIKKDESKFIADHGREALNFQISLLLYGLLGLITLPLLGLGAIVWAATWVLGIVGTILAAVAAGKGRYFRYPACLRMVG